MTCRALTFAAALFLATGCDPYVSLGSQSSAEVSGSSLPDAKTTPAPTEAGSCPSPSDPTVRYANGGLPENPLICLAMDFACRAEETEIQNSLQCGCGCICRPPTDPRVHYLVDSYANPMACAALTFGCAAGQDPFSSACGCGCVDLP
jgi:hypothetical protein